MVIALEIRLLLEEHVGMLPDNVDNEGNHSGSEEDSWDVSLSEAMLKAAFLHRESRPVVWFQIRSRRASTITFSFIFISICIHFK